MADDRYTRLRSISGRLRDLREELYDLNEPFDPEIGRAALAIADVANRLRFRAEQTRVIRLGREG